MFLDWKKPLTVLLGVVLLSTLVVFAPDGADSVPNRFGLIMGCIPVAMFATAAATYKPWEFGAFFCGVMLIGVAIGCYVLQDALGELAAVAAAAKKFSQADTHFWTYGSNLWKFAFPTIGLGIGINIISSFISSSPPVDDIPAPNLKERLRDERRNWRD
jgi:predicted small integral membrane protein